MLYLASGYEERVGEGFESWVNRWDPWKDVRVQGQHVRVSCGADGDVRRRARARQNHRRTIGSAGRNGCRQACARTSTGGRMGVSVSVRDVRAGWMCMHMHACMQEGRPGCTGAGHGSGGRGKSRSARVAASVRTGTPR
ncbi:hypothetical protein CRG98_017341 [Punica granatum]|uniref:Uncharacterized protein n=1 Tax=Punica granatum TaxID=22663 RepID=A0A2I0K117_PUNGR|nr:hypothetical protein CRG98_017341 [Punica granatum]